MSVLVFSYEQVFPASLLISLVLFMEEFSSSSPKIFNFLYRKLFLEIKFEELSKKIHLYIFCSENNVSVI